MRRLCAALIALLAVAPASFAQQAFVEPNDQLVVEGIPKIPGSLVEETNRYTEYRSASLLSWHPTRREMLVATRFGDTAQVHSVKTPGGTRKQLTFFPDKVSGASYQNKTGDFFVFSIDTVGGEFFQNYRYDPDTGDVTLLTDGKSRNGGGVWSNDGERIAYTSTRRTGNDTDVFVARPADPKTDRVLSEVNGGGWNVYDWAPDDQKILVREYISANESYLWLVDAESGQKTPVIERGSGEKVAYDGGLFSGDGKGIYVATDRDSEFMRLAHVDLATKKHTYLTEQVNWDVESFDLSRDGKTLAFTTNEDGFSVLHLMNAATREELPRPKIPAGVISDLEWHENSRDLGFTIAGTRAPADVYSLDAASGKVERWTESETGGLNTANLAEPELVRWKSFDGRAIPGFLYLPPKTFEGKRPVVINIHGGPEGQARPGFLGRPNYFINELGVAIVYPNVRGSSGYGKTFLALDNAELREDSVKDIGALLDWIKTRPELDADRVMVTGGSYGGYMTLAVATNYNDRIRAALDVVGISNFISFLERTQGYRRDLRRAEYGDERDPKIRAFMERIAPLNNAAKITKPLFVVQGQNDPRVPLNEAEQVVAVARKNGTPVWYLMAKDEGHGFAKKRNADFQFYATILFVREHLLK
jgi:dipeptidyl aminopeptidase/acylaminoacyl peptidase